MMQTSTHGVERGKLVDSLILEGGGEQHDDGVVDARLHLAVYDVAGEDDAVYKSRFLWGAI